MILIPAIDLKEGHVVRLRKGDFNQMTVYGEDPVSVARRFEEEGASYLHLVDLDGSLGEGRENLSAIEKITRTVNIPVQVGGGVRSKKKIRTLLDLGIERLIIGTLLVKNRPLVEEWADEFGKHLACGLDAIEGRLYTDGWKKASDVFVWDLIDWMEKMGINTMIYTDITRDGMLKGPNVKMYRALAQKTKIQIIASGGVTTREDLEKLRELGLYGAIIGKALHENKINLREVLAEWKE